MSQGSLKDLIGRRVGRRVGRRRVSAGLLGLCGGALVGLTPQAADPLRRAEPLQAAERSNPRGWRAARWGMTAADLKAAFGAQIEALPGAWDFGQAYAALQIPAVEVGGVTFRALFQMNRADDRLQQILLERRGPVTADTFADLLAALERDYGPAHAHCLPAPEAPSVRQAEILWRFPDTTLHAVLLDFQSTSLLYEDPNDGGIDPLRPFFDSRRIVRRFLPRRLLLRFHPSARDDLMAPGSRCVTP